MSTQMIELPTGADLGAKVSGAIIYPHKTAIN